MSSDHHITVHSSLMLSVPLRDSRGTSVQVKLGRIAAQELANALNEYAGRMAKSRDRKSTTRIASDVRTIDDEDRIARVKQLLQREGNR